MATSRLHQLSEQGQSVWIDFLSRPLLRDGDLERMLRDDAVVGVTSNPTIFQKAISQGDAYDQQIREVLERSEDAKEVFLELAVRDVQDACDLLHDTHERTGGVDGFVSIEVDPHLAYDRDATIAEARRLSELVDRPNVYVKIPATEPGLGAIEETIAAGIPVNVTLIFGLDRYRAGRAMDYETETPESIADAIAAEIGREVDYAPVAPDGAARAAAMIAELL